MRKALPVCVVALLAAGALIVILGLGRVAALWIGRRQPLTPGAS